MRVYLTIIGLIVIALWSLQRPFVGVLAIMLCNVLRETLRQETYGAFFRFHGFEVLFATTILSVVLFHTDRLGEFVPRDATDWGMLSFLAVMVISGLVNGVNIWSHKYIDLFFKAVVLYFLLSRLVDTRRRVVLTALALVVGTSYLVYLAWSKYRSGLYAWARPYHHVGIHDFGLVLVVTLPLLGSLLAWRVWLPVRLALFALIPLYVVTTLRTTSRSAMLGVGFGLALLAWYHRRRWYWLVPAVPFVAYAIVHNPESVILRLTSIWTHKTETGEEDTSIASRFEQMRTAKRVIKGNPLFGIGPRMFFVRYADYQSDEDRTKHKKTVGYTMHSVPLLILCEEGLTGGAAYALLFFGAISHAWVAMRRTRGDPEMHVVGVVATGSMMSFLAFLAYGLGQPSMWVMNIYATVALAAAARRTAEAYAAAKAAAERKPAQAVVAWAPRPLAAETEIVFS